MAMEEIQEKQKDLKQMVDVATLLFERSAELQSKSDDMSNTLQHNFAELTKVSEELYQLRVSHSRILTS